MAFQTKSIVHELLYFPLSTAVSQLIKLLLALAPHVHVDDVVIRDKEQLYRKNDGLELQPWMSPYRTSAAGGK